MIRVGNLRWQATAVGILLGGIAIGATIAWAHPNLTESSIAFDPASPVAEGTMVDITGTVLFTGETPNGMNHMPQNFPPPPADTPVTSGMVKVQQLQDDGLNPVACGTLGSEFVDIDSGTPDANGEFTTTFDTNGLGGQTIGFRILFVTPGGQHQPGTSQSDCLDLVILADGDPFPDGTNTRTQGFFGSSPGGEAIVPLLIDEPTCEEIDEVLTAIGEGNTPYACDTEQGRDALALFLTGEVGAGADDGFLPSGLKPGQNFAAQKITLLLNLNLGEVLEVPEIPILDSYFINIDVLQDIIDGMPGPDIDPVFNNPELYDVCDEIGTTMICDPTTLVLSELGEKVEELDMEGTTVAEILDAADDLIVSGDPDIDVNGVTLTAGDLTAILGMINESYDEGTVSGFVTAFDAD